MSSLEWNMLAAKFYQFKSEARKYGFYTPELEGMERSLELMRPYQESKELSQETRGLVSKMQRKASNIKDWALGRFSTPKYDDNDELVGV